MNNSWTPNLVGKVPPEVERAITQLYKIVRPLSDKVDNIKNIVGHVTTPGESAGPNSFLHEEDINQIVSSLQAAGTTPLNVGGLIGLLAQPQKAMATISTAGGTPATPGVTPAAGTLVVQNGQLFYFNPTPPPGAYDPISAQAIILFDTYANWTTTYDPTTLPVGTLFFISDWNVLYIVETISSVNTWVYVTGTYKAAFSSRPTTGYNGGALGAVDSSLSFLATDKLLEYFWTGSAWTTVPINTVAPGTYGDTTHTLVIVVDSNSRITSITATSIAGAPPTGAAGGDLDGSYPNPGVGKVNGGSIPTGQDIVGTNGSGQIVAGTITGYPGFTGTLAAAISGGKNVVNGIIQP